MKKLAIASALVLASLTATAADYVSVDVENVLGRQGSSDSTAQYIRAGKQFGDYQFGLQGRTATLKDSSTILSSVEVTAANTKVSVAGIRPFVGVGHDNKNSYNYGLVGATYGLPVGPGYLLTGVKTRVGSTEEGSRTKQTVAFTTYSHPIAKNVALNLSASRSGQDIKEKGFGVGLGFSF